MFGCNCVQKMICLKQKYQIFFVLQESAESKDRILILKTRLRGAEVEKTQFVYKQWVFT